MIAFIDVLAITITGFMIGNEIAIAAFVHPVLHRLPAPVHLGAARVIARVLGRSMPFWYGLGLVAILAELWLHYPIEPAVHLLLAAALLWAATIVVTLVALVPPQQPHRRR